MTLKADDVQRKRMDTNVPGDITDSGFKKSIQRVFARYYPIKFLHKLGITKRGKLYKKNAQSLFIE